MMYSGAMENTEQTATIEIDLDVYSKEEILSMLCYMHENDLTFNEFVDKVLAEYVKNNGN
jgi:hypothetical protein